MCGSPRTVNVHVCHARRFAANPACACAIKVDCRETVEWADADSRSGQPALVRVVSSRIAMGVASSWPSPVAHARIVRADQSRDTFIPDTADRTTEAVSYTHLTLP